MLAESRVVELSTGHQIRTPLLVPSVSSAGFKHMPVDEVGSELESAVWLRVAQQFMAESLLISAYDAAHGNLPYPEDLAGNFSAGFYSTPRSLFIDSGVYEIEYGPPPFEGPRLPWDAAAYEAFLAGLPASQRTVLVNYDGYDTDGRAPLAQQISDAQRFFTSHDRFASDILIKPERRGHPLRVDDLSPRMLGSLAAFDIIGFAEKDLGGTVLERLGNLVRLRRGLNDAGVAKPIHLFGSLDPVMSPLYHAAGAEIFDGLSWLRFAYHWDAAVYSQEAAVLEASQNLAESELARAAAQRIGNLRTLGVLGENMRQFAATGNWELFGARIGDRLRAAHVALQTEMGG